MSRREKLRTPEYRLRRRTSVDLQEILVFGIETFGLNQAQLYLAELGHCFDLLFKQPHMGRLASSIGEGVRRHEHKSHVILYEVVDSGIVILAIFHKRSLHRMQR